MSEMENICVKSLVLIHILKQHIIEVFVEALSEMEGHRFARLSISLHFGLDLAPFSLEGLLQGRKSRVHGQASFTSRPSVSSMTILVVVAYFIYKTLLVVSIFHLQY